MKPKHFIFRLIAVLWAGICANAFAQVPPSQPNKFTTSLTGAEEFDSLNEAETEMRATSTETSDLAPRPSRDHEVGNFYIRQYAKPDIRPEPELPWQLFAGCLGDGEINYHCSGFVFATEQAALDGAVEAGSCQFAGLPTEIVDEQWLDGTGGISNAGPVAPFAERGVRRHRFTGPGWPPDGYPCVSNTAVTHVHVYALREYACPAGYSKDWASDGQVYCWHDLEATITEFANFDDIEECEEKGNPCNPATGGKIQTFVDYEAPGIQFARTWRSKVAPRYAYGGAWARTEESLALDGVPVSTAVLPWGWTHSYAMKVQPRAGGIEAFRPDGATLFLFASGSETFVAADGSGVQARESFSDISIYLPDGSREVYLRYFCSGGLNVFRLEDIVDPSGRATHVEYAVGGCEEGPPTSVAGPFGHVLEIQYHGGPGAIDSHIDRLIDSAGGDIAFVYVTKVVAQSSDVVLDRVVYQDNSFEQYLYEDNRPGNRRLLTGLIDETGVRVSSFAYDDSGRATSTERAGGFFRWDLGYNPDGTHTATDANDIVTTYEFQSLDRAGVIGDVSMTGTTRSKSNETTIQHRTLSSTDQRGVTTTFDYDVFHLESLTEATGTPEARATSFAYLNDTSQLLIAATSLSTCGAGFTRNTAYVAGTQLVQQRSETGYANQSGTCQPISRAVTFEYGDSGSFTRNHGLVTAIRGPRLGVADDVTFTYYECTTGGACGHAATITNAAAHLWTFNAYDAHGRVTQITLPNTSTVTYSYDPRGRLETIVETAGGLQRTTQYDYYAHGSLQRVTDPTGAYLEYTYNDARLLTEIRDNAGNTIVYGYDLAGNRTSERVNDASQLLKKSIDYAYDDFNRLESITTPNSLTSLVFDPVGNLTDVTDPKLNETSHTYDSLNRLTETLDALTGVTAYDYDVADQVISVEAPNGAATTYSHDDLGNLRSVLSPDSGTTNYTDDLAGNVITITDARGVTVTHGFDALNRVTSVAYPDSTLNVGFGYDTCTNGVGRLCTMTDGSGSTSYQYDTRGRLVGRTVTVGSITGDIGYAYDDADRLVEITYPTGHAVDYTRNANGQVTGVTMTPEGGSAIVLASNVSYAPFGPMVAMTYGNGIGVNRIHDLDYRLTDQTAGSVQNLDLGYDENSNVTSVTDNLNATRSQTLVYDELDRLTSATSGAYGNLTWSYDANGNRETALGGPAGPESYTYAPDSNRLTQYTRGGTWTVNDDDGGNITGNGSYALTYADHNRLVEARIGGNLVGRYTYNGLGQRVKKDNGAVTLFLYDESGNLVGEYDAMGFAQREIVWLNGAPLAVIVSDIAYFVHTDQLGTPRAITTGTGTVIWRWDSDPFGTTAANGDPDGDQNYSVFNLRFPGQYFDTETNFHYNYFRDYDAVTGRYIQSDPIGLAGGLNPYLYVSGNPLAFADPLGLQKGPRVAPLPQAMRDIFAPAQAHTIIQQIRVVNPSFNGAVWGTHTRADVLRLERELAFFQRQPMCLSPVAARSAQYSPNFIVSPGGTVFPVPAGATGPTPVINPAGLWRGDAFTGGRGGANQQVDALRIMDPTPPRGSSPGYPRGNISYQNDRGQHVDPYSGRTLPHTQSHFPID